ncbi:MAG: BamA/TamA family outer membrane protein, partial [Paracoccaceae bacterium]|nr:BamA/TamA family outer membrane protein [Paracoccaceae bacterium]
AAGTTIPKGYAVGAVAQSGVIREAAETAVGGWRDVGHALAQVAGQDLVADHARARLSADLRIDAGPRLRFGKLRVSGQSRMRLQRILKIAGLPEGDIYDPQELERAAERLRRSGVFRSVSLVEDETVTAPDLLGIAATVVEEKPRRYSFGAELASSEGLALTGSWMHRNLWGGGERLKVQGNIAQIGAADSGVDYGLDITLERPATFSPDTLAALRLSTGHLDDEDYRSDFGEIGLTFSHYFSKDLTARVGLEYAFANVQDVTGGSLFRNLSVPLGVLWDRRDSALDATSGFYLEAEAKPFLGFGTTDSGLRVTVDARAYRTFGTARPVTFAGRAQIGRVLGSALMATPRDFLFYSGGGGTVRGQPYQSLGVSILRADFKTGGTAFLGLSGEVRAKVTDTIGLVAFADAGSVGAFDFLDDIG